MSQKVDFITWQGNKAGMEQVGGRGQLMIKDELLLPHLLPLPQSPLQASLPIWPQVWGHQTGFGEESMNSQGAVPTTISLIPRDIDGRVRRQRALGLLLSLEYMPHLWSLDSGGAVRTVRSFGQAS
jgi:hypothetical protein